MADNVLEATVKKFRAALQVIKGEEQSLKFNLEDALQRREDLQTKPLQLEDAIELVKAMFKESANQYPDKLKMTLTGIENSPLREIGSHGFNPLTLFDNTAASPMALLWCFKEEINRGVEEAMRLWDWPPESECGPPRAERLIEIPKLDKEIAKLQSKLDNIRGVASNEGVSLMGVSMGESKDKHTTKKARSIAKSIE